MKYTKNQIEEKVKKLLKDVKQPYFEHIPFDISFVKNEEVYGAQIVIEKAWKTVVFVQEDQFPEKEEYAIIIIIINDDTGNVESYIDTSCGRPIPLKAKLIKGKYEFEVIQ